MQDSKNTPDTSLLRVSHAPLYMSILFAIVVVGMTIGMFLYNTYTAGNISTIRSQITEKQKEIDSVSRDRNVIISKIESSNTVRPSIDLKWLVNDFYDAASAANVRLKGFSIANDVITTSLIATQADGMSHNDTASMIIKMMRDYATGPRWRFSLDPITIISGTPEARTTAIAFKVTSLPTK